MQVYDLTYQPMVQVLNEHKGNYNEKFILNVVSKISLECVYIFAALNWNEKFSAAVL
jgi:hypothetical protein